MVDLVRAPGGNPVAGWCDRIRPHSLRWMSARDEEGLLVGFANLAGDGGAHAFLLAPKIADRFTLWLSDVHQSSRLTRS